MVAEDVGEPAEDATEAAFAAWRERREHEGVRVDVTDLYAMVAASRGVDVLDLPLEERRALAARAMPVVWPGYEKLGTNGPAGPVVLVEDDGRWGERFEAWRDRLATALGPTARRIEHVGSTSIGGIHAKPLLDLLVTVPDLPDEASYVPACEHVGLELFSRDNEHRFLVDAEPAPLTVHLHVCETGSPFERDHLLFRDYLRANSDERDRYAEMKTAAAARWNEDRMGYTYAKSDLILDLLDRAEGWAAATGWTVAGA
jgi:GrpB-like predicted nucleotidyltransferase (UPF0157 family)